MTKPDAVRLFSALDATWPAARFVDQPPWTLREGLGGGQRVSAATAGAPVTETDINAAEKGMVALKQRSLFMVRDEDSAFDALLGARGYEIVDPVTLYLADPAELTAPMPPATAYPSWPPLAIQKNIWAEGGIGPARIAVMERVTGAKAAILARGGNAPAATAFIAMDGDIAMLHALEVLPASRKCGLGRKTMQAAANWAVSHGAKWMTLAVTRENVAANALYTSLGMTPATFYHYRRAPLPQ